MLDTDPRRRLWEQLDHCSRCAATFRENVALILNETGVLTDTQALAALAYLGMVHPQH